MNHYKKQIDDIIENYRSQSQKLYNSKYHGVTNPLLKPQSNQYAVSPTRELKSQAELDKIKTELETLQKNTEKDIQTVVKNAPLDKQKELHQYVEDSLSGKKEIKKDEKADDKFARGQASEEFNNVAKTDQKAQFSQQQNNNQIRENTDQTKYPSKEDIENIPLGDSKKDERDLSQSQFISDLSQADVEPSLYEQYVKERQDNPLTEPEHDLEQETDYDRYVREREKYPTTEQEPDLYNQYLEEREQHDTSKEQEKEQYQQKEHELDER